VPLTRWARRAMAQIQAAAGRKNSLL